MDGPVVEPQGAMMGGNTLGSHLPIMRTRVFGELCSLAKLLKTLVLLCER
jgi:hypothetical protein